MWTAPPYRTPRPDTGPGRARRRFRAIVIAATLVATLGVDATEGAVNRSRAVVTTDRIDAPSSPPAATRGTVAAAGIGRAAVIEEPVAEGSAEADVSADPAVAPAPTEAPTTTTGAEPESTPGPAPTTTPTTAPAAPTSQPSPTTTVPAPASPPAPTPGTPLDEATAHLDPGGADPYIRALAAYETAVPAAWRAATPIHLEVRRGWTSLSYPSGTIAVGANQMDTWRHALYVLAHEWGHQAAFRFGSGAYNGAPPVGFPGTSVLMRAEQFAECVAQVLVGFRWPNPYPRCPDAAMAWTANWLADGP